MEKKTDMHLIVYQIDVNKEWPSIQDFGSTLHSSQYEALQRMLTKQLSLVQGPPGTGKTVIWKFL